MNKKYIFIALGVVAVAGIGLYVWNKNKKPEEKKIEPGPVKLSPKRMAGVIAKLKAAKVEKSMAATENKASADADGEEVEVGEIIAVQAIPDRSWLERSWADVS